MTSAVTARMSATRRSLVRIERRLASVGCAVKTGRTASPSIALVSPSGPASAALRRRTGIAILRWPGGRACCAHGGPARPRWPAGNRQENARTSEDAVSMGRVASRVRALSLAARLSPLLAASLLCLVRGRTRSTKSSRSWSCWRTSGSPQQSDDAPHICPQHGVSAIGVSLPRAGTAEIGDAPAGPAACGVLVTGGIVPQSSQSAVAGRSRAIDSTDHVMPARSSTLRTHRSHCPTASSKLGNFGPGSCELLANGEVMHVHTFQMLVGSI